MQEQYITCDLCGAVGPRFSEYDSDTDWSKMCYDVDVVCVYHKTGSSYPEGGHGEYFTFDICPRCFHEKLVAWFNEQGIKGRVQEWDW